MSTTAEQATTLSVVVPMYNEEAVLPIMAERLRKVLDGLDVSYEVVAVDDGSTDATAAVLIGLRRYWPQLRIIRLRRNGGHQAALTAGMHRAVGQYVASIDADLQDPPELIKDMLDLARSQNLDIVYGVRNDRSTDTVFKRWTAVGYYRMMRGFAGNRVPHNAGDFRLLSRVTVDALRALPEQQPVYRLLVPWLGFPSGTVEYSRERRAAGVTKYPLTKMVRLAADSVTSFSAAPLRLATWLGLAGFGVCIALVVWVLVAYFIGVTVPGWASLSVVLLFLGAVQLLCLGLLGEYVGRIFAAMQGRPAFFIAYDSAEDAAAAVADEEPVPAGRTR
ncbi:glycosyltransferase family 2 protein [Dactylosporangium sp. NPDC049140]|uniref:glycosyltransferase family 2 protein n=1 Tax=Dactylosporangium sp. NPDC049140 TaxID=3155647 RepID=UPI0033CC6AE8